MIESPLHENADQQCTWQSSRYSKFELCLGSSDFGKVKQRLHFLQCLKTKTFPAFWQFLSRQKPDFCHLHRCFFFLWCNRRETEVTASLEICGLWKSISLRCRGKFKLFSSFFGRLLRRTIFSHLPSEPDETKRLLTWKEKRERKITISIIILDCP